MERFLSAQSEQDAVLTWRALVLKGVRVNHFFPEKRHDEPMRILRDWLFYPRFFQSNVNQLTQTVYNQVFHVFYPYLAHACFALVLAGVLWSCRWILTRCRDALSSFWTKLPSFSNRTRSFPSSSSKRHAKLFESVFPRIHRKPEVNDFVHYFSPFKQVVLSALVLAVGSTRVKVRHGDLVEKVHFRNIRIGRSSCIRLKKKLWKEHKLVHFPVRGDGNCLFRCFGLALEHNALCHPKYRALACEYLNQHKEDDRFAGVRSLEDFETQLKELGRLNTFAEEWAVMALAFALGVSVRVYANDAKDNLYSLCYGPEEAQTSVEIFFVNANHYDLLLPSVKAAEFLDADRDLGEGSLFWYDL